MPTIYDAHASIVNEGTADIERLAVKITRLAGINGQEFIKTFPFMLDFKNRYMRTALEAEMPPYKKNAYIGLGFTSYQHSNYIHVYSTFKSLPLNKGDKVTLYFEDETEIEFEFMYHSTAVGYMRRNLYPISNANLEFISKNKLVQWKLHNSEDDKNVYGGFVQQENNEQYKSEKTGQKLFMVMAHEILNAKSSLNNINTH